MNEEFEKFIKTQLEEVCEHISANDSIACENCNTCYFAYFSYGDEEKKCVIESLADWWVYNTF